MFFKIVETGYIMAIGTGEKGTEIPESEYNNILNAIHNKPSRTETTDYRLREDLTWEEYDISTFDPNLGEVDVPEAFDIIFGGE